MEAGRAIRRSLVAAGSTVLAHSLTSGVSRTGFELLERAERVAGALADRGLQDSTIGLYYRNSAAALEAFIAIELLGATRLPVEPSATVAEAYGLFSAGRADTVLTDRSQALTDNDLTTLVHSDLSPLDGPRHSVPVDVDPNHPLVLYPRGIIGGELFAIPTSYANWQRIIDLNVGLYRSGGYGPPVHGDECYLTVVQLMHATGMVGSFPFLHLGLPQVLLPRFNADAVLDAIARYKITTMFAVPRMLTTIADALGDEGRPPASLRRLLYGGAPVRSEELRRLVRVFGPTLSQLYGRYEAGWPLTILDPDDHARVLLGDEELAGSCGRAVDGVDIDLRPVTGTASVHEVRTRSGMVSPSFADADGWCSLGDTATTSEHGYLRLTGRLDGMINTGSFHVYPEEVREAVLAVPSVEAAMVTGEPDPTWGQVVTAYVVSADPGIATTILDGLRQQLAPYKVPRAVHVVDALPDPPPDLLPGPA